MAQISKGIRLGYGEMDGVTRPTSYVFLPELTGIPALGASPSTHQVTTLMDAMHKYTKGLVDVGGNLDFPCIFTPSIYTAVGTAETLQGTETLEWCIEFPLPLGKRAYFLGEISPIFNESVDVDAPVLGTISIIPNGEIAWETANYTVSFDTDGGSAVIAQTIAYGGLITEPADPTLTSFDFGGWYYDEAYTSAVVFATDKVDESITLYAKWDVV